MKLSELSNSVESRAKLLGISEREIDLSDSSMHLVDAIAKLLVQIRENEGLTQNDLAEMIGLQGAGRISQFESGQLRHAVNLKSLAKICAALGYNLVLHASKADANQPVGFEVRISDDGDTEYYGHVRQHAAAQ